MTTNELRTLAFQIDPRNAAYIMNDYEVTRLMERINHWRGRHNPDADSVADAIACNLDNYIAEYSTTHLTPANVKVGDGVTVNLYTDRHAGTIVKVTKTTITIRRDKATLKPEFKPKFDGMYCTNNAAQEWTYEPDADGELTTLHWSKAYNQYGRPGGLTASKGRHEFHDYNF